LLWPPAPASGIICTMLPVVYQTPAAIILLLGGLLAWLAGYRLFRVVLGIYGFILGALLATSAVGSGETAWLVLAAIGGGIVGALVLVAAYFVGVALIGAGLAAFAVHVVSARFGLDPHPLVVILFAIAGALAALSLQRYVIIVGTAFAGAWTMIVGALAMMHPSRGASAEEVWLAYPTSPSLARGWIIVAWIVLGIFGTVVQFRFTGRGSKKKKKR
jgi:hypothetical protein